MEKTPWRTIFIGTGSSILLFFIIYLFLAPGDREFYDQNLPDRPVQFHSIKIMGRNEGQPSWYFAAESGYSTKNQETTVLENVSSGEIFRGGEPVLKDMRLREAVIHRQSKEIEGFKAPNGLPSTESGYLSAQLNMAELTPPKAGEKKKRPIFYTITADYLKYSENNKKTEIKGQVRASGKKYTVYGGLMEIDHEKEISRISENVRLYRKNFFLSCSTLEYISKDEKIISSGKLKFILTQAKHKTNALATSLVAYNDEAKDILMGGPIYLSQAKKSATADQANLNEAKHTLTLTGGVDAVFEKGQQILDPEDLRKIDNPETKEILKQKTQLLSDSLLIFTDTENAQASGKVIITQKGKEAHSDFASYDEKKDQIVMTGNVEIKKENGFVKCQKVIVLIRDESFTAIGEVKSEFIIKRAGSSESTKKSAPNPLPNFLGF